MILRLLPAAEFIFEQNAPPDWKSCGGAERAGSSKSLEAGGARGSKGPRPRAAASDARWPGVHHEFMTGALRT